jgi:phosphopantothenoylcysteine decarboxylase/phosphopantothenate--cysteine ligase
MWIHPATVANVQLLRARGVVIIEPAVGRLTGEDSGAGRLPEPEVIVSQALSSVTNQDFAGKRITIAAGGTREPIDSVRFIGNRSSGKQGIALADAASSRGATVTLIAINIDYDLSRFSNVVRVSSTDELSAALNAASSTADAILMPAAVSDFRVSNPLIGKMHREDSETKNLELVANPDLLAGLSRLRMDSKLNVALVGFAAEVLEPGQGSNELIERAKAKLAKKGVDMIVANDVSNGQVFDAEDNSVSIVTKEEQHLSAGSKLTVANSILDVLHKFLK